jgi:hypothetical protein
MTDEMYLEEIRLSRELARAIEQITTQYGGVVPHSVYSAYLRLVEHYQKEMELGIQ